MELCTSLLHGKLSFVCGLNISKRIMSVFPGFGGWINQNIQQRPEAESGRSENVKSSPVSEKDTNLKPWYDEPGKTTAMEPGDFMKEKMKFMKVFEGSWKVEPLYVDQERFCRSRSVNSQEEYKKCSGGRGRIASMPSTLLNLPPVSWIIRGITIKITKMLLEDLRKYVIMIHKSDVTT
ncbi:Similar to OBP32pep protein gb/U37698 from Arabidopsis thaliana [Arabidopsis thaliana]|uniref:F5O8.17 protein n=1 Tax=Arabidopsis thaliana TaxID=3702 RepID=Q9ZUD3_ARATH|nr:Similar to OBP32pep protein gb/U37698 from Arabidopsis thaliana [Arabidopsis thaliana]